MDAFIGNQRAQQLLAAAVAGGSAHAVLLGGPNAVGKRTLAQRTIAGVVGRTVRPGDPDVLDLSDETIAPGGIGRDVAVRIVKHLSRKPVASPRSCVLLPSADRLTIEAANALLVTLEEPPAHALILLTADNPAAVVATIRSRCLPLQLTAVPDDELQTGLESAAVPADQVKRALALAAGRPGRALRYLRDEAFAQKLNGLRDDLTAWQEGALPERLALAARYGTEREAATDFLEELDLMLPLNWRRGLLDARRRLARNVQPRAALEAFAMLLP